MADVTQLNHEHFQKTLDWCSHFFISCVPMHVNIWVLILASQPPLFFAKAWFCSFWIIKLLRLMNMKRPSLCISRCLFCLVWGTGPCSPPRQRRLAQGLTEDAAVAQHWRMEVSDGGERTKEDRIGDSLVMEEKKQEETQVLQHHQLPGLQNYSRVTSGREGRREG